MTKSQLMTLGSIEASKLKRKWQFAMLLSLKEVILGSLWTRSKAHSRSFSSVHPPSNYSLIFIIRKRIMDRTCRVCLRTICQIKAKASFFFPSTKSIPPTFTKLNFMFLPISTAVLALWIFFSRMLGLCSTFFQSTQPGSTRSSTFKSTMPSLMSSNRLLT